VYIYTYIYIHTYYNYPSPLSLSPSREPAGFPSGISLYIYIYIYYKYSSPLSLSPSREPAGAPSGISQGWGAESEPSAPLAMCEPNERLLLRKLKGLRSSPISTQSATYYGEVCRLKKNVFYLGTFPDTHK